ncbi:MAG: Holliday junction resolvase RuvX [Clostridia bacterium]
MRCFAFDVGDRRIGLAVSDPLNYTAQGIQTFIRSDDFDLDIQKLAEIVKVYDPCRLIFGLPRNMNGSEGFQAENVRDFADKLCAVLDKTPIFIDERLTTVSANRILIEGNVKRDKRKGVVDKLAATIILQGFLDSNGGNI